MTLLAFLMSSLDLFSKYIIGLLKFPLYIVLYTLGFMLHLLITNMPPSNFRRFLTRVITIPIIKLMLILLGKTSMTRQLKPQSEIYSEIKPVIKLNTSDIIITNSSLASIFMCQLDYSPVFAVVGSTGKLSILSFYSMIAQVIKNGSIINKKSYQFTMEDAIRFSERARCPLVLLPEGDLNVRNRQFVLPEFSRYGKRIFICGVCEQKKLFFNSIKSLILALGTVVGAVRVSFCLPQDIPDESMSFNEFVAESRRLLQFVAHSDHSHYS